MPRILIVDDDSDTREMLTVLAQNRQLACDTAASLAEARSRMLTQTYELVLCDLVLPDGNGIELFEDFTQLGKRSELVFATGHATLDTAINALRQGASDYLVKPFNMQRLDGIFARVAQMEVHEEEIGAMRAELERVGRFGRLLGNSPPMRAMYDALARVATTDASVLLTGESGTGKEVAAQTLHELSFRRRGPFVAINCGAIPANLVESEMFGHDRGSFTGADRQHKGFFERADGGTLFLDEITEMPVELQVKLLRVLETGQVTRLGSVREISIDVRIVAATNRDPEAAIAAGTLRADLYHRINVFPIPMPPLRERGTDIMLLADAFLARLNEESGRAMRFGTAAKAALARYEWPGNVRELRNFVQRASIFADGDAIDTLPPPIMDAVAGLAGAPDEPTARFDAPPGETDRRLIRGTPESSDGVKAQAAEILDISLKTVYQRITASDGKPGDDAPRSEKSSRSGK